MQILANKPLALQQQRDMEFFFFFSFIILLEKLGKCRFIFSLNTCRPTLTFCAGYLCARNSKFIVRVAWLCQRMCTHTAPGMSHYLQDLLQLISPRREWEKEQKWFLLVWAMGSHGWCELREKLGWIPSWSQSHSPWCQRIRAEELQTWAYLDHTLLLYGSIDVTDFLSSPSCSHFPVSRSRSPQWGENPGRWAKPRLCPSHRATAELPGTNPIAAERQKPSKYSSLGNVWNEPQSLDGRRRLCRLWFMFASRCM